MAPAGRITKRVGKGGLSVLPGRIAAANVAPTIETPAPLSGVSPLSAPPAVPGLPDTQRLTTYTIVASTGPFAVNFALYGDGTDYGNWIEVWLNDVELVAGAGYTLSSPTGPIGSIPLPITDAEVTLAVAGTGALYIQGARRPRRVTQFAENHGVAARDLNQALTDIVADQREAWDFARTRAMYFPGGETVSNNELPIAALRTNAALLFDSNGNPYTAAISISGSAGVIALSVTRATFSSVTMPANTVMLSGYTTAGDKGMGATYSSVGASPTGTLAIQDHSGTWFNLVTNGLVSVGWFGVKGDGVTDDSAAMQAAISTVFPQGGGGIGGGINNLGILYFPAGQYILHSQVSLTGIVGAHFLGAGRNATEIIQTGSGNDCWYINGIAYSTIEGICFTCQSGAYTCLELDFSGGAVQPNSHSIVVRECLFNGGTYGVALGASGQQVSEVGFFNNYFANPTNSGIISLNQNVLNINIYGGDFEGCPIAINAHQGFFEVISGVAFENGSNTYDIVINNSSGDGCAIIGCRSESTNFLNGQRGLNTLIACNHAGIGTFVNNGVHHCALIDCSTSGTLSGGGGLFDILNCEFGPNLFANSGANGRIRNSQFNGNLDAGPSTYVADGFFIGGASNNGLFAGLNGVQAFTQAQGSFVVFPSGFGNGYNVSVNTDANARLSMQLDGSNNPIVSMGPATTSPDVNLNRQGVNKFGIGSSATATDGALQLTQLQTTAIAMASLPAASGVRGARYMVNNSSQAASANFGAILSGTTGANVVPVYSDGTNWRIG